VLTGINGWIRRSDTEPVRDIDKPFLMPIEMYSAYRVAGRCNGERSEGLSRWCDELRCSFYSGRRRTGAREWRCSGRYL
jgi:hypothetical protein